MAHPTVDEVLNDCMPKDLLIDKHIKFLIECTKDDDCTRDYLKLSGVFWTLTALDLVGGLDKIDKEEVIKFVLSCQKPDGGFSPAPNHDSHILSTLSAIQVLSLYSSINLIDSEKVCNFVCNLQQPDGSFAGDIWGEIDTRFSFCAVASICLLGKTLEDNINVETCANYLERCQNLDGGFGTKPGSESHAGQAYCVVGAMSLLHQLHRLNLNQAAWWLSERQLPSGGLNGRPEKKPDVCYSWWAVATLAILGRIAWIKSDELARFITASQDEQLGGIADRPGNMADPFHTLFGLAGMSLIAQMCTNLKCPQIANGVCRPATDTCTNVPENTALLSAKLHIKVVNPVFCMPQDILDRNQIKPQLL